MTLTSILTSPLKNPLEKSIPPHFTVAVASICVEEGQDATFHCEATGLPRPKLLWQRSGEQIHHGDNRFVIQYKESGRRDIASTLIVLDVVEEDSDTYVAVATNEAGEAVSEAGLVSELLWLLYPIITHFLRLTLALNLRV